MDLLPVPLLRLEGRITHYLLICYLDGRMPCFIVPRLAHTSTANRGVVMAGFAFSGAGIAGIVLTTSLLKADALTRE